MESVIPALAFLAAIGCLVLILIVVYYTVQRNLCCCHMKTRKVENLDYDALGIEDDESDTGSFFNKPYLLKPNNQYELRNVTDHKSIDYYMTSDSAVSDLDDLKSHKSVKTAPQSAVTSTKGSDDDASAVKKETDRLRIEQQLKDVQKKKKDPFLENVQIKLSLLYSKSDMFLMLTVNEVTGIPPGVEANCYQHARISITLLPEKKYRSKTKIIFVGDESTQFNESFKFSNVSRESLFSSAFRFRLYGKSKRSKEICLGEVFVHLADVAQRSGGFLTWRTFQRKTNT